MMKKAQWFLALCVLGVLGTSMPGCGSGERPASSAPTPQTILPTAVITPVTWQTYQDADLHFSFESPIALEVNKPPVAVAKTVEMEGQSLAGDFFLRLGATEVKYEVDLSQEMAKQVRTLQSMDQVLRNLQVTTGPVTLGEVPGLLADGTAHLPGRTPWEVKLLKVKKDTTVLDLFLQFPPTDEGKAMADRVLNSLRFSN